MASSPNSGSFAVDGSGQIIRAGNQVHIRDTFMPSDRGTVVSVDPDLKKVLVDVGAVEDYVEVPACRVARIDDTSEPLWVNGSR